MTNWKRSCKSKLFPEKSQIVFHSSRSISLGSQGRTPFGGIVKETASSLGKYDMPDVQTLGEVLRSSC